MSEMNCFMCKTLGYACFQHDPNATVIPAPQFDDADTFADFRLWEMEVAEEKKPVRLTDRGWLVVATTVLAATAFLIGYIGGPA